MTELLEAKHHSDTLLDTSMILLNQVIQVFRRALLRVCWQRAIDFQIVHRAMGRSVAVQRDRLWRALVVTDSLSEEGLGRGDVAPGAQPEVDCAASPINGTV